MSATEEALARKIEEAIKGDVKELKARLAERRRQMRKKEWGYPNPEAVVVGGDEEKLKA